MICGLCAALNVIFMAHPAHAERTGMKVSASIIQCGKAAYLPQSCMKEVLCCRLLNGETGVYPVTQTLVQTIHQAHPFRPPPPPHPHDMLLPVTTEQDSFFTGHDADGNGMVTPDEFTRRQNTAPVGAFAALDRNGDGALSKSELFKYNAATGG